MIIWAIPAIVAAVAALPLFAALRVAKAEAAALRAELAQLGHLRASAQALGVELRQLQGEAQRRSIGRPSSPRAS